MADIPVNANDALTVVTVTSAGQVSFDYDFRADNINDLKANFKRASGAVIALVGGVDFTASGIGTATGGTITITSITDAVIGENVSIYRDTIIARPNDYSRDVFVEDLNAEQDKIFMILQEQNRDLKRATKSVLGAPGYEYSPDLLDGDTLMKLGNMIVPGPNAEDIAGAEGYAAEAKAARDEAIDIVESIPAPGAFGGSMYLAPTAAAALLLLGLSLPGAFGADLYASTTRANALASLQLDKIHPSVLNGHLECVPHRAWAIANYHPVTFPDYIQTAGYASTGDLGGALYKRVGSQPTHEGKLSITLADGTTVVWYELAERMVFPEMFGAKGDDPGNGTGTDDRTAFQNAFNFSRCTFLRPARTYRINGSLSVPRFQQIIGLGRRSATEYWVELGQTGATRLVFTGSGTACFVNQDGSTMLSHGGMSNFIMRALGSYTWMMSFNGCVDWHVENIGMQTDSMTMGGFNSAKIGAGDTWTNSLVNVSIRLPDGSSGRTVQVDWSDSIISRCHLTGGVGALEYGPGCRWLSNQIERSSFAGLTLQKGSGVQLKNSVVVGNSFDANVTHGILVTVTASAPSPDKFHCTITGNNFRTVHYSTGAATGATIGLSNSKAASQTMGVISSNVELAGVTQIGSTGAWTIPNNALNMQG